MEKLETVENILVLGLGISGVSTVKLLKKLNKNIYVYDKKSKNELTPNLEEIEDIKFHEYFGGDKPDFKNIDLVIKSPGMPPSEEIIEEISNFKIEIISDIELAYLISDSKNFIVVTGTNGKTTVTTLLNEVFLKAGKKVILGGNIGYGILDNILDAKEDDIILIEASSFQLNNINKLKPKIAIITNIGSDHLDWHGSVENYQTAKKNIYKNQDKNDYIILDSDDEYLMNLKGIKSSKFSYSIKNILSKGVYIQDDIIKISDEGKEHEILNIKDIKIFGDHNLKNILSVVGTCYLLGINLHVVKNAIIQFNGVEHRLEYVDIIKGVKYINDSKGTNIESTIVAIKAFKEDKILILGGKDEGASFEKLAFNIDSSVKNIILFGETKDLIKKSLDEIKFTNVNIVDSLEKAVELSYEIAKPDQIVLFSPACASYDMFKSYIQRGLIFKKEVQKLKGV